ncbi:MAG TPA: ATP-dependent sacrificial sulfur transferase LarE [Nitrospirota bacterium]|nr:ATP-dependent sacrificial sulfur transferase LarE [Nitrospirota bacterium]
MTRSSPCVIIAKMVIERKWAHLKALLHDMQSAVLAYSGGVDSSLLLRAASEVMGSHLIAVTAVSATYPAGELSAAEEFARSQGVMHRVLHTEELDSESFVRNNRDRCYHCKKELFEKLRQMAESEDISAVIEGSNTDDLRDYRPGRKAAQEFSVRSPLVEAGISKAEVRELARTLNLAVWDKPSLACLSSRIPYGTRITPEILEKIQSAEDQMRVFGFRQVRVRHHGKIARIELSFADFGLLLKDEMAAWVTAALKKLGYTYVCLDLEGYRTGSMNEGMNKEVESRP